MRCGHKHWKAGTPTTFDHVCNRKAVKYFMMRWNIPIARCDLHGDAWLGYTEITREEYLVAEVMQS
jgi:hypothetical protein